MAFISNPYFLLVNPSRFTLFLLMVFFFFSSPLSQELTYVIKQDIAKLNKQIAILQQYVRDQRENNKQADEHSSNVVVLLQSKLADTSMSFKDVLEIRTQVLFWCELGMAGQKRHVRIIVKC